MTLSHFNTAIHRLRGAWSQIQPPVGLLKHDIKNQTPDIVNFADDIKLVSGSVQYFLRQFIQFLVDLAYRGTDSNPTFIINAFSLRKAYALETTSFSNSAISSL